MAIAKKTSVGTSLKVKKLKEVDIPDEPFHLQVKKYGSSIFLERTAEAPPDMAKAGKAKISWSDPETVSGLLSDGEMTTQILAGIISEKYGVDKSLVTKELNKREDIQTYRKGDTWRIPGKLEFDL